MNAIKQLLLPVLGPYVRHRRWRRHRAALAAHYAVLRSGDDMANNRLLALLETAELRLPDNAFSGMIEPAYEQAAITCLKQKLLWDHWGFALAAISKHVSQPGRPLGLPFPLTWLRVLQRTGVRIHWIGTAYQFCMMLQSALRSFRATGIEIENSLKTHRFPAAPNRTHIAFHNLWKHTIRPQVAGAKAYTLLRWYRMHFGLPHTHFVAGCHAQREVETGPDLTIAPYCLPRLSVEEAAVYTAHKRRILRSVLAGIIRGQWWRIVMAQEALWVAYVTALPASALAQRYVFHAGNAIIRPLWSYAVERNGALVSSLFYSANFETFTPTSATPAPPTPGLGLMSWPHYVVPSEHSRDVLASIGIPASSIEVAGAMDFVDDGAELQALPERTIAVFDVPPFRTLYKATRGNHNAYYEISTLTAFLDDLVECAGELGFHLALKTKRGGTEHDPKAYVNRIARLSESGKLKAIPYGVAPRRLAENCCAIIALPFTTPALLGRELGIPSIYYDPTASLRHAASVGHGLPVVFGKAELKDWLANLARDIDRSARRSTTAS